MLLVQHCCVNVPKEWHKYPNTFWVHHIEDIPPHSLCLISQGQSHRPKPPTTHTISYFKAELGLGGLFSLYVHTLQVSLLSQSNVCVVYFICMKENQGCLQEAALFPVLICSLMLSENQNKQTQTPSVHTVMDQPHVHTWQTKLNYIPVCPCVTSHRVFTNCLLFAQQNLNTN